MLLGTAQALLVHTPPALLLCRTRLSYTSAPMTRYACCWPSKVPWWLGTGTLVKLRKRCAGGGGLRREFKSALGGGGESGVRVRVWVGCLGGGAKRIKKNGKPLGWLVLD